MSSLKPSGQIEKLTRKFEVLVKETDMKKKVGIFTQNIFIT